MNTWLALSFWRGMTVSRLQLCRQRCGSLQRLFALDQKEWLALGLPNTLYLQRVSTMDSRVTEAADWLVEKQVNLIGYDDVMYPACLREIPSAPLTLYAKGDLQILSKRQLAIVGSRKATPKAREVAYELAGELAAHGVVVTSGLALGIDAAAHRGALAGGGQTVAVMANGLASVYPPNHRELAEQIAQHGVLLSEQLPGIQPQAKLFPQRNRIISGLSQGVLVVQANCKSGSLITARLALEQNREVMAIPGEAGSEQAAGCHWLLKQGAALVESCDDIFTVMGWEFKKTAAKTTIKCKTTDSLSVLEQELLHCIDTTDTTLDKIFARYDGDSSMVLTLLSQLELAGVVERTLCGYCRC